ncbi:unnamed protein product [Rhodiola kirilowii]
MAQNDTDSNTRLEAAKASLGSAKLRFEAATKQLNAAKGRFEAAKIQLDQASSSIAAEKSHLEDDKAALVIKVSEMESEKTKLEIKVSELENDKFELSSELQGSKAEIERLMEKMKGVVMKLDQCNEDKITIQKQRGIKPKVFLNLASNGLKPVHVVIELDYKTNPLTAENFRALCTGEKGISQSSGKPLHYKGTTLTCYGPHWFQEGGDDGPLDADSIYGLNFPMENFINKHDGAGIVSMNALPEDTNGSQFLISNEEFSMFDDMYVAFGHVVEGIDVLIEMMEAGSSPQYVIVDCGEVW